MKSDRRPARPIDLRSDICSQPTAAMREAMDAAPLGWATYGEDRAVEELEALGAAWLGQEACVLVPTCGMANLTALLVLARPGDAVLVERESHVLRNESQGITELARLRVRELDAVDGRPAPEAVERALPGAAVLWLENTHTRAGGRVLDVELTRRLVRVARATGARVHVDGARLANAAAALDVPLAALVSEADTVALSLNKGLCAPYGALFAGSRTVVAAARRRLHQLGGGTVHKAGIGAAAGLVALRTMLPRLADDHRRARQLAEQLGVDPAAVETNIVFLPVADAQAAVRGLAHRGVRTMARDQHRIRFVTHRLIGDDEVAAAVAAVERSVDRR